jgi:hypothetical protein
MGHTHKYHFIVRLLALYLLISIPCQFAGNRQVSSAVVLSLSLKDLVQQADLIAFGRCEQMISAWDAERKQIFTDIQVALDRCLKASNCPGLVTIRQVGGKVDHMATQIPGAPEFHKGERVILFLRKSSATWYQVLGLSQGKFTVISRGGSFYVKRDLRGLTLVQKGADGFQLDHRNRLEGPVDLETFIRQVESYLR